MSKTSLRPRLSPFWTAEREHQLVLEARALHTCRETHLIRLYGMTVRACRCRQMPFCFRLPKRRILDMPGLHSFYAEAVGLGLMSLPYPLFEDLVKDQSPKKPPRYWPRWVRPALLPTAYVKKPGHQKKSRELTPKQAWREEKQIARDKAKSHWRRSGRWVKWESRRGRGNQKQLLKLGHEDVDFLDYQHRGDRWNWD